MRYYEMKGKAPEKLLDESVERTARFFIMRLCIGMLIAGGVGCFMGYVYRKYWTFARTLQSYSLLVGGLAWIVFVLLAKSLGFSISKITYEKLKCILKNQKAIPFDDDMIFRKRIYNSLFKMDDRWTTWPSVYKGSAGNTIGTVVSGPGGVFGISAAVGDPRKEEFLAKEKALISGTELLSKKLGTPVERVMLFQRNKRNYKPKAEDIHAYGYQELNAYLTHKEDKLSEEELEKINETLHEMSQADMTNRII